MGLTTSRVRTRARSDGSATAMRVGPIRLMALVVDSILATRLHALFVDAVRSTEGSLRCVTSGPDLFRACQHGVDGIIIEASDGTLRVAEASIARLRSERATLPILAYCSPDAVGVRAAVACVKVGADDVLVRGAEDMRAMWRMVVERHRRAELMDAVIVEAARSGVAIDPLLRYCLAHADRTVTVGDAARALGVHRKTLVNRARARGLLPPAAMIAWGRLLHAAYMLRDPCVSVERVALSLGFGSGTALRNMFRRYLHLRPSEVRALGAHHCVARSLHARLREASARARTDWPRPSRWSAVEPGGISDAEPE